MRAAPCGVGYLLAGVLGVSGSGSLPLLALPVTFALLAAALFLMKKVMKPAKAPAA